MFRVRFSNGANFVFPFSILVKKNNTEQMRVRAEFPESTVFRDRGHRTVTLRYRLQTRLGIPTPEGHLSHPRHSQLSMLHRRERERERRHHLTDDEE